MKIFGLLIDYNPKADTKRKEKFMTSASFLHPSSHTFAPNLNKLTGTKSSMSVLEPSHQPTHPYKSKILLKNVQNFIIMENNMVAVITEPSKLEADNCTNEAEKYPRLLILLFK